MIIVREKWNPRAMETRTKQRIKLDNQQKGAPKLIKGMTAFKGMSGKLMSHVFQMHSKRTKKGQFDKTLKQL